MALPTTLVDLFAQWQPGPHGPGPHGPHWGGGHHWGAGPASGAGMGGVGFGGWWLLTLLVLLLVATALYLWTRTDQWSADGDGALAVLRERYAAGDLDDEEFERRRERLTGRSG